MKKKTILIVDDDEETQNVLSLFIENLGYQAELKEDATSTKKWLSSNKPDLVLLDIMLPDMTGIGLCKWINSQENIKNIPIIHTTAMIDDVAQQDSMLSGARDFITKPIDFKVLEEKIKLLLDEKSNY